MKRQSKLRAGPWGSNFVKYTQYMKDAILRHMETRCREVYKRFGAEILIYYDFESLKLACLAHAAFCSWYTSNDVWHVLSLRNGTFASISSRFHNRVVCDRDNYRWICGCVRYMSSWDSPILLPLEILLPFNWFLSTLNLFNVQCWLASDLRYFWFAPNFPDNRVKLINK